MSISQLTLCTPTIFMNTMRMMKLKKTLRQMQSKDRTNLPMKLPRLRQSIYKHRMILQMILGHPRSDVVIGLWVHFLGQAVILHIKNDALVRDLE